MRLDVIGRVESAGEQWQQTRTLVDDEGRAAIWRSSGSENVLVWSGRATVERRPDALVWDLATTDGRTFTATRAGCGCGSRLTHLGVMDLVRAVA